MTNGGIPMIPEHLSIDEKRDWLASIFRDDTGAYSQADKFKALAEDTRLALLQQEEAKERIEADEAEDTTSGPAFLEALPPPKPMVRLHKSKGTKQGRSM